MSINIAIDGPSGAGKSTISQEVAARIGFTYVDTGALYRAIGLYIFRKGLDPSSAEQVVPCLPEIEVSIELKEDGQHIYLCGEDVSKEIRRHEMSHYASAVSAIGGVRDFLLELQRGLASKYNCIMDGRDIGTVVLPNAQLKIFLTAEPEDRADRRHKELELRGDAPPFEKVYKDLLERDERDSTRAVAPLKQAEDAIRLDTTGNSKEKSVELVEGIIRERFKDEL